MHGILDSFLLDRDDVVLSRGSRLIDMFVVNVDDSVLVVLSYLIHIGVPKSNYENQWFQSGILHPS